MGVPELLGRGVYYGAPSMDQTTPKKNYCIVGGANSAGQAAVHLASVHSESQITMFVRGSNLNDRMSQYLIDKINDLPNIETKFGAQIAEAKGETVLEKLTYEVDGNSSECDADALYVFIGASPKSHWLSKVLSLDSRGFILTGRAIEDHYSVQRAETETSMPGVFVAGDVRANSVKRVVAATGDGGRAIQDIHRYLPRMNGTE